MSEVSKPVEAPVETPVVASALPVVDAAPETKIEEPATTATATDAPASTEPVADAPATSEEVAAAEETTPAVVEPAVFSGEGTLGYKAPGGSFLKKFTGFSKKFFWVGEEAIEPKSLAAYIRAEKSEVAHNNVAWSSQTGKGLLYFSKHAADKATPAGIINLADISEVTEEGTVDFFFTYNGSKHVFQATTTAERDSWIAALRTGSTEAKESAESIKASEGFKKEHEAISKPLVAVAAAVTGAAGVAAAVKAEEKKEDKKEESAETATKDEEAAETPIAKEEKKEEKVRSQSKKRASIFGGFNLGGKKEAKPEIKDAAAAETSVVEATPVESEVVAGEPAPLDGPAVAAVALDAPVAEEPTTTKAPERPVAATKRNSSIFTTLSSRFGSKKSPVTEDAPAVPEKDIKDTATTEPISAEAPVIPEAAATEALTTPAVEPTVEEPVSPVVAEDAPVVVEEPATKTSKRKSTLPFGFGQKKEKTSTSDSETEKTSEKKPSPFAKLRQTVKKASSPKAPAAEKEPAVPVTESAPVTDAATKPAEVANVESVVEPKTEAANKPKEEAKVEPIPVPAVVSATA